MQNVAGLGKRILGGIIDIVVIVIFAIIWSMLFGSNINGMYTVTGIPAFIEFLVVILYYIILDATTGKTIGKYIVKTKVVNAQGGKISWGQSIGRNLMRIIDGLFVYLVAVIAIAASKDKQRLGDMVAKTYVVKG
ncbi:MAG: RDD family protein [Patescibacteria group bacterium]|jgi:uncharacterized RDD family membrane protein YckC